MQLRDTLLKYYLRYTAVSSQSAGGLTQVPSTPGQTELACLLAQDLAALGLENISVSSHSVVTGRLPANTQAEGIPVIGWCCHTDTVDVNLSADIHPILITGYQGGDICQNAEKETFIRLSEHPELEKYIGDDILVSDGTSVLGADNKAAIANVMTMLEVLKEDPSIHHGDIYIAFVPDEEVGLKGAKCLDLSLFPVDYAYTIDCCEKGELVYETFNAGSAHLQITGVSAHPMSAKNILVNPTLVAVDFINMLDRAETPEHTEKTEGFIWVTGCHTDSLHASVNLSIRDHDKAGYEQKKAYLQSACEFLKVKHPRAKIELTIADIYGNIRDSITESNRKCIDDLYEAMQELGITPNAIAMRGGTDGSYLSTKGILTPNYFTGAHNFHSSAEFLPMSAFEDSCRLTLQLVKRSTAK